VRPREHDRAAMRIDHVPFSIVRIGSVMSARCWLVPRQGRAAQGGHRWEKARVAHRKESDG
jgi:hypothetical protein